MKKVFFIVVIFILAMFVLSIGKPINVQDEIYEQKGQIDLRDLDISYDENAEIFVVNNNSKSNVSNEFYDLIKKSDELKSALIEMCQNGEKLAAIGYTTIYFEKIENNNGKSVLEPLSVTEVNNITNHNTRAIGDTSTEPYGNFTLYTAASYDGSNINATSVAEFGDGGGDNKYNPAPNCFDYISIAVPSEYIIGYSKISTACHGSSKIDDGVRSVIYSVLLSKGSGNTVYRSTRCSVTAIKNDSTNSIKIGSSYVHNYQKEQLSGIDISSSSYSISYEFVPLSWQVSSSVVL